jgi:glycine/D-amino acid oxidase-like deaminating enzyme
MVCHNYGHGGHGVTLSWGTAKHATKLVKELLNNHFNNNDNIVTPSKL